MSKILIAIFTILLVIVLGELSYILFLNEKIIPTPTPALQKTQTTTSLILSPNHAVDLNGLSMLTYWQKGVVTSAKITMELKGTIIEINTNGKAQEHDWPAFNYALKIKIQGENKESNDIFISEEELQKTVFKKLNTGNTTEAIDYKELKVSDKIQALMIFDLTKDFENNFVSGEIIKL